MEKETEKKGDFEGVQFEKEAQVAPSSFIFGEGTFAINTRYYIDEDRGTEAGVNSDAIEKLYEEAKAVPIIHISGGLPVHAISIPDGGDFSNQDGVIHSIDEGKMVVNINDSFGNMIELREMPSDLPIDPMILISIKAAKEQGLL